MAELVYNSDGRLLFTKEMKKEYTLLMPQMLPIHFGMMKSCLELEGFKVDMLTTEHRNIVDTGLKYVHNDTCYPALLVIGQLIDAVQSGKYDVHKIALLITQTGGGCRASNYIHLLRKALKKADLEFIPVISVNLSGLEKNPGFSLTLPLIPKLAFSMLYGDAIMLAANRCRPYEVNAGETDAVVQHCQQKLINDFKNGKGLSRKAYKQELEYILQCFDKIEITNEQKPKVGIVGEIYVKFSSLGNNNLEKFLISEGAEPVVPGLIDFMIFKVNNRVVDVELYGGKAIKRIVAGALQKFFETLQRDYIEIVKRHPRYTAPEPFSHMQKLIKGYLGYGNKMGEGWLLTGEMLDLIHSGVNNIVCTQPFGCLPNHIVGKGMIRRLKDDFPDSNIVAIDYDPGATKINQENRIKLMLANASRSKRRSATEQAESVALN